MSLEKKKFKTSFSKTKYEEACQEASRRIIDKLNEQFADGDLVSSDKYKKLDLFAIVFVGGLFNLPVVKASLLACFERVPKFYEDNAEQTIALGGAMHGEKITDGGTIPIPPFAFSAPEESSSA